MPLKARYERVRDAEKIKGLIEFAGYGSTATGVDVLDDGPWASFVTPISVPSYPGNGDITIALQVTVVVLAKNAYVGPGFAPALDVVRALWSREPRASTGSTFLSHPYDAIREFFSLIGPLRAELEHLPVIRKDRIDALEFDDGVTPARTPSREEWLHHAVVLALNELKAIGYHFPPYNQYVDGWERLARVRKVLEDAAGESPRLAHETQLDMAERILAAKAHVVRGPFPDAPSAEQAEQAEQPPAFLDDSGAPCFEDDDMLPLFGEDD